MVQRLMGGPEFSMDLLCDLDGRCLNVIPRTMIESRGGESIKGTVIADPELIELGRSVGEALGVRGPCTVQAFRDPEIGLGITDVNTRFGGAFAAPMYAARPGRTYPELIVRMAAGERSSRTSATSRTASPSRAGTGRSSSTATCARRAATSCRMGSGRRGWSRAGPGRAPGRQAPAAASARRGEGERRGPSRGRWASGSRPASRAERHGDRSRPLTASFHERCADHERLRMAPGARPRTAAPPPTSARATHPTRPGTARGRSPPSARSAR